MDHFAYCLPQSAQPFSARRPGQLVNKSERKGSAPIVGSIYENQQRKIRTLPLPADRIYLILEKREDWVYDRND